MGVARRYPRRLTSRCAGAAAVSVCGPQGPRARASGLQERGVPTWQRERVPLLFDGKQLLAAVGVASSQRLGELWPGISVVWVQP